MFHDNHIKLLGFTYRGILNQFLATWYIFIAKEETKKMKKENNSIYLYYYSRIW